MTDKAVSALHKFKEEGTDYVQVIWLMRIPG
jgi:hypothetical protein